MENFPDFELIRSLAAKGRIDLGDGHGVAFAACNGSFKGSPHFPDRYYIHFNKVNHWRGAVGYDLIEPKFRTRITNAILARGETLWRPISLSDSKTERVLNEYREFRARYR